MNTFMTILAALISTAAYADAKNFTCTSTVDPQHEFTLSANNGHISIDELELVQINNSAYVNANFPELKLVIDLKNSEEASVHGFEPSGESDYLCHLDTGSEIFGQYLMQVNYRKKKHVKRHHAYHDDGDCYWALWHPAPSC